MNATVTTRHERAARFKASRTLRDVGRFIRLKLERFEDTKNIEGFGPYILLTMPDRLRGSDFTDAATWESVRNRFRWLASYAVTGNSEGHYVHVDLVWETADSTGQWLPDDKQRADKAITVFTGKTFDGIDAAYAVARRVAILLDA